MLAISAAVGVVVGLVLWAWVGWAVFSLGVLVQLVYHLRHFARLERWSNQSLPTIDLEGDGPWDPIFSRLYRHEKDLCEQIARRDGELERFIAAGQALTDGVVAIDQNLRIIWCNTTAEEQLGINFPADQGLPIVDLVRQPPFVRFLVGKNFSQPLAMRSVRNGELALSIHVIPYAEGHFLMQIKDVTQTERLDRMRRDFVANVSHELRTPLTVVSGFVETLREIEMDQEQRQGYLDLVAEQSERMLLIVQDLLTLSSLEAAPAPPDNERIDMESMLDKLRRDAEALSNGRHDIQISVEGCADLRGAESEIASAFGNLVSNAVRYTPPGGRITLVWRVSEAGAEFAVEDTGIGIDPKHIPRLTERFYRVDRSRSRETGGTGLGLAIVKHALSRHQAVLDVTSKPGQGSRFAARFSRGRLLPA